MKLLLPFLLFLSCSTFCQELSFQPKVDLFSIPNFEINTDEITDIQTDSDGYVWIVSLSAIYKYNGRLLQKIRSNHTQHRSFLRFHETGQNKKFVNDYLGNIFFIEGDSLRPYRNNHILRSLKVNRIYTDLWFDKELNLHVAYDNSGYKIIKGDSVIDVIKGKVSLPRGMGCILLEGGKAFIYKGVVDSIEQRDRLPCMFKLIDSKFKVLDSLQYFTRREYAPVSITTLPNNNYLFSTGRGSLIEFNSEGIVDTTTYPDIVIRLFVDKKNNLWISTMSSGIHYYSNSEIDYPNKKVLFENTKAFLSAQDYQGGLWSYSAVNGLGYISSLDISYLTGSKGNSDVFEVNDNDFFFAEGKEVYQYDEANDDLKKIFVSGNKMDIIDLFNDTLNRRLWVASSGEWSYISENEEKQIELSELHDWGIGGQIEAQSAIGKDSILAISKEQYFYCINDSVVGVSELFPKAIIGALQKKDFVLLNNLKGIYKANSQNALYLGDKHELAKSHAKSIISFNNEEIFSFSSQGIFRYADESFKEIKFNGKSVLGCDLIVENDSTFWGISADGCFSIIVQSRNEEPLFKIKAYKHLPRLAIKEIDGNSKTLFFTTHNKAIGKIDYDQIRERPLTNPKLIINRIETTDSIYYGIGNVINLEYNKRNIRFSFESLDFQNLNLSYRYILEGYDDNWVSTTTNQINYVSLPAGNYSFKVQSKFGVGDWGEKEVVHFTVLKPFWQKEWFILGSVFLTLFVIYQIIYHRFRTLHKRQSLEVEQLRFEQKALRAQMAPHYIFNVIASLKYLIVEETREKADRFLDLFASSMRNVLDEANSNYITVQNEIKFITEYIEMERFRLEGSFDYEVLENELKNELLIPPFMVQPFVENAIKHGLRRKNKGGKLLLKFKREGDFLKVTIEDNGVGRKKSSEFKSKKKKSSYGIKLIEKRLAIHNSLKQNISITDLQNENNEASGTRVVLFIRFIEET